LPGLLAAILYFLPQRYRLVCVKYQAAILVRITFMRVILNITIEQALIENAQAYAAEKNTTVSQLVEDYFKTFIRGRGKGSLLDVIDNMPKPQTNFPGKFDFKREYYEARAEKYGFGGNM
jgi:hypothetical protein